MRVYEYDLTERHCREGYAVEIEPGDLRDTFWGVYGSDRHKLTPAELETAVLLFDTDDYEDVTSTHNRKDAPDAWSDREDADRQRVTAQHGLQPTYFIRKGSEPSLRMKIENAREDLRQAEEKARSAAHGVEWAQRELDALLGKAIAATV
jgi:hypothetical protein